MGENMKINQLADAYTLGFTYCVWAHEIPLQAASKSYLFIVLLSTLQTVIE